MKVKALTTVLLLAACSLVPARLHTQSTGEGGKAVLQVIAERYRAIRIAKAVEAEEQAFIAQYGYAIPVSIENLALLMQRVGANLEEAKPILDYMVSTAKQYPDPSVAQWQWLQMMALMQSQQWGGSDSQMRLQRAQEERKNFEQERWKSWAESFGNPYQ